MKHVIASGSRRLSLTTPIEQLQSSTVANVLVSSRFQSTKKKVTFYMQLLLQPYQLLHVTSGAAANLQTTTQIFM